MYTAHDIKSHNKSNVSILYPYTNPSNTHYLGITNLFYTKSSKILSTSRDGSIKLWEDDRNKTIYSNSDWITEMKRINGDIYVSGSYDCSIKLIDVELFKVIETQFFHKDYVKCLDVSNKDVVVSGAFDGKLSYQKITNNGLYQFDTLVMNESIYSLVCNQNSVYFSTVNKQLNHIDMRDKQIKKSVNKFVNNHDDIVKCLTVSGNYLVSGGSDKVIKFWDYRNLKSAVKNYNTIHNDSVWTLKSINKDQVLSGARDGKIVLIDCLNDEYLNICQEDHPILCFENHDDWLWVGTTDSSFKKYDYKKLCESAKRVKVDNISISKCYSPMTMKKRKKNKVINNNAVPVKIYKGNASVKKFKILNNKRQILLQDSENRVTLWDIMKGEMIKDFDIIEDKEKFEEIVKDLFQIIAIPNWFSVEIKLGSMQIVFKYDTVFNAILNSLESGYFDEEGNVNLGEYFLRSVFKKWFYEKKKYYRDNRIKECSDIVKTSQKRIDNQKRSIDERIENIEKRFEASKEEVKELYERYKFKKTVYENKLNEHHFSEMSEDLRKIWDIIEKWNSDRNGLSEEKSKIFLFKEYTRIVDDDERSYFKKLESNRMEIKKALEAYEQKQTIIDNAQTHFIFELTKFDNMLRKQASNDEGSFSSTYVNTSTYQYRDHRGESIEENYMESGMKSLDYENDIKLPDSLHVMIKYPDSSYRRKIYEILNDDIIPFWVTKSIVKGGDIKRKQKISFSLESYDKKIVRDIFEKGSAFKGREFAKIRDITKYAFDKLQSEKLIKVPTSEELKNMQLIEYEEREQLDKDDNKVKCVEGKLCKEFIPPSIISKKLEDKAEEEEEKGEEGEKEEKEKEKEKDKIKPEDFIELSLKNDGKILDPNIRLGTIYHYYRNKNDSSVILQYRIKYHEKK